MIAKEDTQKHILNDDESAKIKAIFEKTIGKPNMHPEVESLSADELPVIITMNEFMRRMKDMAKMGGGMNFYGAMPDTYKVAINGNHPLIGRILQSQEEDEQKQLARQAFDLGLLAQGMLSGSELTEFVNRSVSLS